MRKTAIVIATVAAIAAAWYISAPSPADANADYRDPETVALGQTVYVEHCASCHGQNLQGQPNWQERDADGYLPAPPHDETGHTWHHPTAQLFEITKLGTEAIVGGGYKSNMIGFGDLLTDAEIHAVLAYIKSTWPRPIQERHDQMNAASQ